MATSPVDSWDRVVDTYIQDDFEDSPMKEKGGVGQQVDAATLCLQRCSVAVAEGRLQPAEFTHVRNMLLGKVDDGTVVDELLKAEAKGLSALRAFLGSRSGGPPASPAPRMAAPSPVPSSLPPPLASAFRPVHAEPETPDRRSSVVSKRTRTPSFVLESSAASVDSKSRRSIGGAGDSVRVPTGGASTPTPFTTGGHGIGMPAPPATAPAGIASRPRRNTQPAAFTFDEDEVEVDGEDDESDTMSMNTSMGSLDSAASRSAPRKWSPEEDEALRSAVEANEGRNWKAIAARVPGRNHVQCLQRWKKVLRPGLIKGHWTEREDKLLRRLVSEAPKNWGQVAAQIPGRTAKQCRERWCNHLDPRIKKGSWSSSEDATLMRMYGEVGQRWSQISKHLPGRTENAVKIRWKTLSRTGGLDDCDDMNASTVSGMSGTSFASAAVSEASTRRAAAAAADDDDDDFVDARSYFRGTPATSTASSSTARSTLSGGSALHPPPSVNRRATTISSSRRQVADANPSAPAAAARPPVPPLPPAAAAAGKPACPPSALPDDQRAIMMAAARHQAQQIAAANPSVDINALQAQIMAQIEVIHAQIQKMGGPPAFLRGSLPPRPPVMPPMPPLGMMDPMFRLSPDLTLLPPLSQQSSPVSGSAMLQSAGDRRGAGRGLPYDIVSPLPPDAHFDFLDPSALLLGVPHVDDFGGGGGGGRAKYDSTHWPSWADPSDMNPPPSHPSAVTQRSMAALMAGGDFKPTVPHPHEMAELSHFLGGGMGGLQGDFPTDFTGDLSLDALEHDALFGGRVHL